MIYIVLGMHKSGTTMVTKILHKSGINMGPYKVKGDYYKGEDFERIDVFHVISDMLHSHKLHSLDTIPPFDKDCIKNNLNQFAEIICKSNAVAKSWGFKNPRTVFIYNYIRPILGEHKLICIYRDLRGVVTHYTRSRLLDIWKSIKAWKIYNKKMIGIVKKENSSFIVLKFEKLLEEDKEFLRLEDFVGIKLEDFRNRRSRKTINKLKGIMINLVVNIMLKCNLQGVRAISNTLSSLENY